MVRRGMRLRIQYKVTLNERPLLGSFNPFTTVADFDNCEHMFPVKEYIVIILINDFYRVMGQPSWHLPVGTYARLGVLREQHS